MSAVRSSALCFWAHTLVVAALAGAGCWLVAAILALDLVNYVTLTRPAE